MVLESAQMLSIAGNKVISGLDQTKIYKTTAYTKHPCTLWAGRSLTNFIWLIEHSLEIGKEYNRRYKKHHKSLDVIMYIKNCLLTNLGEVCYALEQQKSVIPFALAMPDKYQDPVNLVSHIDSICKQKRVIIVNGHPREKSQNGGQQKQILLKEKTIRI